MVIYGVLKAKDMRETIRIRMAANEHDRKKNTESSAHAHAGAHGDAEEHPHGHQETEHHAQLPSAPSHHDGGKPEGGEPGPDPEGGGGKQHEKPA